MSFNVFHSDSLKKRVFETKPADKDGLLLTLHHRQLNREIRLLYASFNKTGRLLAVSDHSKNLFILDVYNNRCWGFPSNISSTALKFSEFNDYELVVGTNYGEVHILHVETSKPIATLTGHTNSVKSISFMPELLCLTASKGEGLIWDFKTFSRLQVLSIESGCTLKIALFIPQKSYILASVSNDTILIWKYSDLQCIKKISSAPWYKGKISCISITRNGRVMVLGGYSNYLAVFLLDDFSLSYFIELSSSVRSVKDIQFIPQPFDGGAHKLLTILAGNGILYFYDMEANCFINQIKNAQEIAKFSISSNGEHLACIFNEGFMNVYKLNSLLKNSRFKKAQTRGSDQCKINSFKIKDSSSVEVEVRKMLSIEKLKNILSIFGKYPDHFRLQIWTQLLQLPKNNELYNGFINNVYQRCFPDLERKYPLENKLYLKNLRRLLSNLVTWSPFLKDVSYLPIFVFPFVKIFRNNPVVCFEAVCTIIINWCQYWFEYFPLPPANILGIIGNLLLEHDQVLAAHLSVLSHPKTYIWPLLETCFSEVLTSDDWCCLWDHILTNEPYFLHFCVVAYNIVNREVLLSLHSRDEFEYFYHNANPIDIKKVISKSYKLMNSTCERNHPKQYLYEFAKLEEGHYPKCIDSPSIIFVDGTDPKELLTLENEKETIQKEEEHLEDIINKTKTKVDEIKKEKTKNELLEKLEIACKEEIKNEREQIQKRRKKLEQMRMALYKEELKLLDAYQEKLQKENVLKEEQKLTKMRNDIENTKNNEILEVAKAENDFLRNYVSIVKQKINIDSAFSKPKEQHSLTQEQMDLKSLQNQLHDYIKEVQDDNKRTDYYKALCLTTSKNIIENLIQRVQFELISENKEKDKLKELESASLDIEKGVSSLLKSIGSSENCDNKEISESPPQCKRKQRKLRFRKTRSSVK
ncbi:TBC1 domain family member 31 [Agrilus planipennis]|uniref:TBC1 domain family member 31 n=1 Tax=Agrilus planipennis TaxID=224129 RepID=A0A1W4XMG5_AGRPL|nr:TBC1 domain family member 31 [Agrilus planipennis]